MNETQQAEYDWANYYLVARVGPLSATTVVPEHFGQHDVATWYRRALERGAWVDSEEIGIPLGKAVEITARCILSSVIPEVERRIVLGWAVRQASLACADFSDRVRSNPDDFEAASQKLLQALTEAQAGMPVDSVPHAKAGADAIANWLTEAQAPEPRAIPFPWETVHQHTHGLPRKKLVFVGGRSSEHKTTFARSIAVHAATKGFRVLYWTLEDNTADIAGRTIVDATGFPTTTALATGGWPRETRPTHDELSTAFAKTTAHLEGAVGKNLRYLDRSNPTRQHVIATIRAEAARGLDLFVGDFVQLVQPDDPRHRVDDSWWRTTCALLSGLAQDLDIAMLWVSQIEKTGTKESAEAKRLPKAVEMPYGAQLFQGCYGCIMVGFEGERFKAVMEKWKSAKARGGVEVPLVVEPKFDRIVEV